MGDPKRCACPSRPPDAQVWDTTHRCHRQSMIDPQRSDAAPPQALVVTELMVTGMCCQSEVALIRKKIGMLDGVVDLKFNLMLRRCTVTHTEDLTAVQLLRPLNWAALGATVLPPKGAGGAGIQRGALCRPGLLVALLSLLLFGLSNGIWARPDGTEWWEDPFSYFALSNVCAHRRRPQSAAAQSTETHGNLWPQPPQPLQHRPQVLLGLPILLRRALTGLLQRRISMFATMAIACVGALVLLDLWEASAVVFFYNVSPRIDPRAPEIGR